MNNRLTEYALKERDRVAYDYDRQRWVSGDDARVLLILQLAEETELLFDSEYQSFSAGAWPKEMAFRRYCDYAQSIAELAAELGYTAERIGQS